MKRSLDIILAFLLIILFFIPMFTICMIIILTSKLSPIYWSSRVGINNKIFKMPKFRTMRNDTPELSSEKLNNPASYYIPFGSFLRKSSLDELPQLWSILLGDMTFVGPRPALFNQSDLIKLRTQKGIHKLVPGLTGWAQVNGRDLNSIKNKVKLDLHYMKHRSVLFDIYILFLTLGKIVGKNEISH